MKLNEERQGRENKIFKNTNNQIIIACCIKLRVQEMTMNKKLTMIGLTNSGKLLIFDILWIICNKIEKYRKWLRKGALDLTFPLLNDNMKTLLITISIHVVIRWHHLDNNVTF